MAVSEKKPPGPRPPERAGPDSRDGDPSLPLRCDFCGEPAPMVRRVALDRDYERLQTPHPVRYACSRCSEEKERSRQGLRRG